MDYKKISALFLFALFSLSVDAQLRLPAFDISFKTGYVFIPDEYQVYQSTGNLHYNYQYQSVWAQGELNLHVGQRIAVGGFYNKSVIGNYINHEGDQPGQDAEHLMYGVSLRLSSGRSVRVRPYLQMKVFKFQAVVHGSGFDIATKCNGAMANIGLMIRLSNKLYLNIPDLQVGSVFERGDLLFRDMPVMVQAGVGITYNFTKRK